MKAALESHPLDSWSDGGVPACRGEGRSDARDQSLRLSATNKVWCFSMRLRQGSHLNFSLKMEVVEVYFFSVLVQCAVVNT